MADIKWIKFMVGTFDGASFKKIKKATLKDGTSYRDKLTAIWFELLELAAKRNRQGQLCLIEDLELPFTSEAQFEDIAIMIDRTAEEVECCMAWYIKYKMITIVDDVYSLANWDKYQEVDKLAQIREQNRVRVAKHREQKKQCNVTVTLCNALDIDKDIEEEKEKDIEIDNNNTLLIHSNNINYEELARELVNLWNLLRFEKKEELTDSNYNVIVKACKHFGVENVVAAIQNYEKVLFSDYYFSHVWNLKDFFLSAKGLPNFLPEGETWKAYKKNHKGSIFDGVKPAPKPKGESNPVVKGFLDSIV